MVEVEEVRLTRQRGSVVREEWWSSVVWSSPKRTVSWGGRQAGHLRRGQCWDVWWWSNPPRKGPVSWRLEAGWSSPKEPVS
jgi:hypothetical protein